VKADPKKKKEHDKEDKDDKDKHKDKNMDTTLTTIHKVLQRVAGKAHLKLEDNKDKLGPYIVNMDTHNILSDRQFHEKVPDKHHLVNRYQ
jgi:hypothetical protein